MLSWSVLCFGQTCGICSNQCELNICMTVVVTLLYVRNVPGMAWHHLDGNLFHLESHLFQRQLGRVIPALSAPVSLCKLIPVGNTQPKWLAESSWLVSCLASGLHFRTSGTALPVSATVCGKMRIWERNRIPLLCTPLKCCCKCRTFASAALNIWVNL